MHVIKPLLFVTVFLVSSAMAGEVHKWVDENGITHYSDKAPKSDIEEVTLIEIPASYSTQSDNQNDYYSITNQWMRIREERLAMEKIKLEKAKQKASQQAAAPQIVYLNDPGYSGPYFFPHHFPNNFKHHKFKHRNKHKFRRDFRKHHRKDRLLGHSRKSHFGRHAIKSRSGHRLRHARSTGLSIKIR